MQNSQIPLNHIQKKIGSNRNSSHQQSHSKEHNITRAQTNDQRYHRWQITRQLHIFAICRISNGLKINNTNQLKLNNTKPNINFEEMGTHSQIENYLNIKNRIWSKAVLEVGISCWDLDVDSSMCLSLEYDSLSWSWLCVTTSLRPQQETAASLRPQMETIASPRP